MNKNVYQPSSKPNNGHFSPIPKGDVILFGWHFTVCKFKDQFASAGFQIEVSKRTGAYLRTLDYLQVTQAILEIEKDEIGCVSNLRVFPQCIDYKFFRYTY